MIVIIDNYDSFTYNLVQLLAGLGAEVEVLRNDAVEPEEVFAGDPHGVVISPGPGTPDSAGISCGVVRLAGERGIPVLGVCLGHQCIAQEYGARIVRGSFPVHGKTDEIIHDGQGLMRGVPSPLTATRYHSLVVEPESVPDDLVVSARTADGTIMGLRHSKKLAFGVQFHPESILTPEGVRILRNFLELSKEVPAENGMAIPVVPEDGPLGIQRAIARVIEGRSLSEQEATEVMGTIMDGEASDAQIGSLLTALRMRGETIDEITGFARAMRDRASSVRPTVSGYIDTCGTGGDGQDTFNISTVTTFVVAGTGVPIAKHGNRSVSSRCGSADVLEELGVRIDLDPAEMARCVDEVGVGFLFAQALHPSMRYAAGPRRELASRTVFNILGPLTNPAGAKRQLLGVYDPDLASVIAEVAGRLGSEKVLVVNGHPGMDEVSASGPTRIAEYADGEVSVREITPEELGISRGTPESIKGGDPAENASIARRVLEGERGPCRDVVLMNAAAALVAAGRVDDLADGVARASGSIDTGAALSKLEALVEVSRRLAEERQEGGERG